MAPTGGDKDIDPPKILNISTFENSNQKTGKTIKFDFNEYIQLNEWENHFYISPPTKKQVKKNTRSNALYNY